MARPSRNYTEAFLAQEEAPTGPYRWAEATPRRSWPRNNGTQWPTNAEYHALRAAKRQFDATGFNTSWCSCHVGCDCGDKNWAAVRVAREWTADGAQKIAGVRSAGNRYGYESVIYASQCQHGAGKPNLEMMYWDGVPLRVPATQRQYIDVDHGTVFHHIYHPAEHRKRVMAAFRKVSR